MSEVTPPSSALLDLARRHTRGDASPRRHQASRARVLDRLENRRPSGLAFALVGLAVVGGGGAAFAGVKAYLHDATITPLDVTISKTSPSASANERGEPAIQDETPPEPDQGGTMITVAPDHAVIYWDDKKLEDNPARFRFAADHKPHRVRAEAPGYVTKTQIVMMDQNFNSLDLELKPIPLTMGPIIASAYIRNADSVVESLRDTFQSCYTEGLITAPTMAGKVTLVVHLEQDGDVANVEIAEKEGLSSKVASCLASAASDGVHFSTSNHVNSSVRIPLAFHAK